MTARWQAFRESVRNGFWAVPTGCVTVAVVLSLLLVQLDRSRSSSLAYTFGAGPDGAREVLSAITTAMITFTGLVFSITVVVLQLTSSQFSPRVLRTFLRDRLTQYALGVFTATFVYTVMVLRTVHGGEDDPFVPSIATSFALLLLLLSVALFVAYIHHIATSIQASSIVAAIGAETRHAIDGRFPPGTGDPADGALVPPPVDVVSLVLPARRSGVVTTFDEWALVRHAATAGVVLRTSLRRGDFVPEGAPLLEVVGDPTELHVEAVLGAVAQGRDRTLQQDVAFGLRHAGGPPQARVYEVMPTGPFEDDPNVTDKKFPGNPTRSYRSREPLRVVGDLTDWPKHTPEELEAMLAGLARLRAQGLDVVYD